MSNPMFQSSPSRPAVARFALVLAACALSSACSGDYPLGAMVGRDRLIDGNEPTSSPLVVAPARSLSLGAPDITLDTDQDFGPANVAAIGDLDGDGQGDVALSGIDPITGKSYVQVSYGGARLLSTEATLTSDLGGGFLLAQSEFALTVSAAGDVDGDGYADLLVRSVECNPTQMGDGAYLVYGGPKRLSGTAALADVAAYFAPPPSRGEQDPSQGFGCIGDLAAAGTGDLDGDGIGDFALTVTLLSTSTRDVLPGHGEGVYLFYGRHERFAGQHAFSDADAWLQSPRELQLTVAGDVNGDGLADLLIGSNYAADQVPGGTFFIPGRSERWSGSVDLVANAVRLEGVDTSSTLLTNRKLGDLDGDGLDDLILKGTADGGLYLFYGAPGLFASDVDLTRADARLEGERAMGMVAAGDRDGDGIDDALDWFSTDPIGSDVAAVSGSRMRLSGDFALGEAAVLAQYPNGHFPDPDRHLSSVFPAGDIDGDGASDTFAVSWHSRPVGRSQSSFANSAPQLHIFYGAPVTRVAPLH